MGDCNCLACQIREQLESSVMPEVETRYERELVELALVESQSNVNNANAVGVLTNAMQQLLDMGEPSRANAVGRMLDELLPPEPQTIRPSMSTDGEAGTTSAEAPKSGFEPMTYAEFVASVEADKQQTIATMAKELADMLGVPVDVFSFSKR